MQDAFDNKLKEMAKKSKIKESDSLRNKINITCENLDKKTYDYKRVSWIAAAFIIIVVLSGVIPTYANDIPVVKKVLNYFNEKYDYINEGYEESSQSENIKLSTEKYKIDIEDIYYDGVEITIFYKINSKEPFDKSKEYMLDINLQCDVEIDIQWGNSKYEIIDDYTYVVMEQYYMRPKDGGYLPEVLNGVLLINGVITYDKKRYEYEELNLDPIEVSLDSTNIPVEEVEINTIVSKYDDSCEYLRLKKYPTGIKLDLIRGEGLFKDNIVEEFMWDTKKGALKYNGRTYDDSSGRVILTCQFESPSDTGKLLLVPYIYTAGPYGTAEHLLKEYEIKSGETYDLGNLGTIEIEKIESLEMETIITIRTKGLICAKPYYELSFKDENGQYLDMINEKNREVYGFLDMKADYIFTGVNENSKIIVEYIDLPTNEIIEEQIIPLN